MFSVRPDHSGSLNETAAWVTVLIIVATGLYAMLAILAKL